MSNILPPPPVFYAPPIQSGDDINFNNDISHDSLQTHIQTNGWHYHILSDSNHQHHGDLHQPIMVGVYFGLPILVALFPICLWWSFIKIME